MERHKNNIGLLRLMLALMVIVGHAPEMIDGNRAREPLTVLFHTISLGELAVDGFFVISGYLIAKSMIDSPSLLSFLSRRVLRIYPAFILAYLLCVLALAPNVGGHVGGLGYTVYRLLLLGAPPQYPGQLAGLPIPALDGSMWTISYEFRCYLLIAVLGVTGLLRNKAVVLAITLFAVGAAVAETFPAIHHWSDGVDARSKMKLLSGSVSLNFRLLAPFMVGACYYSFKSEIWPRLTPTVAIFCVIVLIPLLFVHHAAEAALAILGGAALFRLAFHTDLGPLQKINDRWDVSYGVYLYGWPIAITILWFTRMNNPVLLAAITIPIALGCGAASWWGLERWTKDLGRRRRPKVAPPAPAG